MTDERNMQATKEEKKRKWEDEETHSQKEEKSDE